MSTTHFTGPVASANGFINTITGATVVAGSDSSIIQSYTAQITITSAQFLTLFTVPTVVLPAPGANKSIIITSAVVYKPAGTAYSAGGVIVLGYNSGLAITTTITATGFIDQVTAQTRILPGLSTSYSPSANTSVVVRCASADPAGGNTSLVLAISYQIVPTVLS